MAIRILECNSLIPDEGCSFIAIRTEDEIAQALEDHLDRFHADPSRSVSRDTMNNRMLRAVYVSCPRAYVGADGAPTSLLWVGPGDAIFLPPPK